MHPVSQLSLLSSGQRPNAAGQDRTPDLRITRPTRCQLRATGAVKTNHLQTQIRVDSSCFVCIILAKIIFKWAHGVVVSHPLRMRKALGSIPSVSNVHGTYITTGTHVYEIR